MVSRKGRQRRGSALACSQDLPASLPNGTGVICGIGLLPVATCKPQHAPGLHWLPFCRCRYGRMSHHAWHLQDRIVTEVAGTVYSA